MSRPSTPRPPVFLWPTDRPEDKLDITGSLLSVSAAGNIEQPATPFNLDVITVDPGRGVPRRFDLSTEWWSRIPLGSVVSIGMQREGGCTLGFVTSVNEVTTSERGGASKRATISGLSVGRVLSQDSLVTAAVIGPRMRTFYDAVEKVFGEDHPVVNFLPSLLGPTSTNGDKPTPTFVGSDVQDAIDWVIERVPSFRLPLMSALYGDPEPRSWIHTDQSVTAWNAGRIWQDAARRYHGTAWTFLRQLVDADFYEVFIDTMAEDGSEVPRIDLVVRPRPYDLDEEFEWRSVPDAGARWSDLRTRSGKEHHVIPEYAVESVNLNRDEQNVYSWYLVTSDVDIQGSTEAAAKGLSFPVLDLYMAQRFGMRPYNTRLALAGADVSRRAAGDEAYDGEVANEIREFRDRLVNWHRYNPWMIDGSITIIESDELVLDDIRPGDPIFMPWAEPPVVPDPASGASRGIRAYVVSIGWSWSLGDKRRAVVRFVRGQNPTMLREAKRIIEDSVSRYADGNVIQSDGLAEMK